MAYADVKFYKGEFKGEFEGSKAELLRLLELASVKVDELTFGRIRRFGFEGLTEFQRECVKMAVCYQADFYAKNGIEGDISLRSYRALDVSVWYDRIGRGAADHEGFSKMGMYYLERSGLCSRAV